MKKQDILKILASGNTKLAIKKIDLNSSSLDSNVHNDMMLISARYNNLERNRRLGVINDDFYRSELNQINRAIIETLDLIPRDSNAVDSINYIARYKTTIGLVFLLILIMFISFKFKGSLNGARGKSVSVFVHGKKSGTRDLILKNKGKVEIVYGDAARSMGINEFGQAIFNGIPDFFFEDGAKVSLSIIETDGEPFQPTKPDSLYTLVQNEPIFLEVELLGLDKLEGVVKDASSGEVISGANVWIQDIYATSDSLGRFKINIPFEKQRKFQTVHAYKIGYIEFKHESVPLQTFGLEEIFLEPTNH